VRFPKIKRDATVFGVRGAGSPAQHTHVFIYRSFFGVLDM